MAFQNEEESVIIEQFTTTAMDKIGSQLNSEIVNNHSISKPVVEGPPNKF